MLDTLTAPAPRDELQQLDKQLSRRNLIYALEGQLKTVPGAILGDVPESLTHSFANGIYMREIALPEGTILTGKIHRHSHPSVLLEGEVMVFTEQGGQQHLKAPLTMISEAGTKRAILALSNTRWLTFHNVGEERDLAKIEEIVIARNYAQLEAEQRKKLT